MLTYRFSYAPHGPENVASVTIDGGRRKALSHLKKTLPGVSDWRFINSVSPTGLIRN